MATSSSLYLSVAMTLTCLMYTAISFLAWRVYLRKPYTLFWHIAFIAATARWAIPLIGGRALSPSMLSLLVEFSALGVIFFASVGHCFRAKSERVLRYIFTCAVVGGGVLIWSTLVSPHDGLREAAVPAVSVATAWLLAFVVYRNRPETVSADHVLATSLSVFGAVQLLAATRAYGLGRVADSAALQAQQHIEFLTMPIAYVAISTLVMFLFVSDMSHKLRGMAVLDQLTGLLNRHGYEGLGQLAFSKALADERALAVVIADLDHFKAINDRYGHAVGDKALVHFAQQLQVGRKQDDVVARIGGEEFLIVLPDTSLDQAEQIADMIRVTTETSPLGDSQKRLNMSASFGVAELSDEDDELSDMVARADRALYRAKRRGRNRVERAGQHALTLSETTLRRL